MFELPMTSYGSDKIPAICLQYFQRIADFDKGKLNCFYLKSSATQSDIHLPHRQIHPHRRMRLANLH